MPATRYSIVTDGKKRCSRCDNLLPVSEFRRSAQVHCGYRSDCKVCSTKAEKRRMEDRANGIMGTTGRPQVVLDANGCKPCSMCNRILPAKQFGPSKVAICGLASRCKECNNARTKSRNNRDLKTALRTLAASHKKFLVNGSKRRNAWLADSCVCTEVLHELWKEQDGRCLITGIEMTHICGHGRVSTNLSIDRIDNAVGYTRDNIRLVCRQANVMKHDLSDAELVDWCKTILDHASKTE